MALLLYPAYQTMPDISRRERFLLAKLRGLLFLLTGTCCLLVPPHAFAADSQASKFYADALVRYEKKDIAGAIIQLKSAIKIDRKMLPVQMLLGKALLQNGEVVAAEVALTEALRLGANRAEIVVPLGQSLLAQGKPRAIFDRKEFALAGLPSALHLQVWLLRSAASTDLGDTRNALQAIDKAREIDPKSPAVLLAEIPGRVRARQFKEAMAAADRALAVVPNSADAWYQKGSIAQAAGDLPAALNAYEKVLKLDTTHVEVRVARAGLYLDLARLPDAAGDLEELKTLSADDPRTAYLRALLAERQHKPDEAKAALKEVTALIDPVPMNFILYRPQVLMLNALAHFGLNEIETAKQYLAVFHGVQGNTPASKLLAQIHLREGRVDPAIDVLESYLKAIPADGEAMALLGSALMAKGKHAQAASLMQKALKTRDSPEYHTVLGLSLVGSGQSSNGISELEAAYKKDPRQIQAATALVGIYVRGGQAAKADQMAEGLVKRLPTSSGLFNLLGMVKEQAGNVAAAKKAYGQAVKLDAKMLPPKINLARLEIATKNYIEAATGLSVVLKMQERNAEAMYLMAILSYRQGQVAATQTWLEQAAEVAGPLEIRWGLALADFYLRTGRPALALAAAKHVAAKSPDERTVLLTLARAHLAGGDHRAAKSSLVAATRVAEYNAPVQVQIAVLQLEVGNVPGATYSLGKALSGRPGYLPAMAMLTEIELRQSEFGKAEQRAREIVEQSPKRAIGHMLLGDVAMARGQTAVAVDAYRRAQQLESSTKTLLRLFRTLALVDGGRVPQQLGEQWMKTHPTDTAIQKALADSYARAGNFSNAQLAYKQLLKLAPNDVTALNSLDSVIRQKIPDLSNVAEPTLPDQVAKSTIVDILGTVESQADQSDRDFPIEITSDVQLRRPDWTETDALEVLAMMAVMPRWEAIQRWPLVQPAFVSVAGLPTNMAQYAAASSKMFQSLQR